MPLASTGSEGSIAHAILLALLVSALQAALGLLRLGVLANFLSHPLVLRFTNAAENRRGRHRGVTAASLACPRSALPRN